MPYPYRDFREWIADEEAIGQVIRVKTPIKCGDYANIVDIGNGIPGKIPETEIRAFARYLHSLPGKPIGIIENPVNNRPDIPVVINCWPGRERTLRAVGCKTKDEMRNKLANSRTKRIKSRVVPKAKALCKEVIIPEEQVDVRTDIPRNWVEFNQMLWSACNGTIVGYDPETGAHDLSKCRLGQYEWMDADPSKPFPEERVKKYMFATLIYMGPVSSDFGRYYYQNYRVKNKPCPAAYILDIPTDFHTLSTTKGTLRWPETGDEYEALGGFRGEPVDVVNSETIPGLMVPAHAEWVIEGEFLPEDTVMPPYSEDIASGYVFGGENCPVFRVKCITHRKNPWWSSTTFSSLGLGQEGVHTGLYINYELEAKTYLCSCGFKVKDVVTQWDQSITIVQLEVDGAEKPLPYYGRQVGMVLFGNPTKFIGPWTKYLIIVGPDIDPYDWGQVMWALGTRTMPKSDSLMIDKGLALWGDPGGFAGPLGWKTYGEQVIIDALVKVPERYDAWLPRSEPVEWEKEAINKMKKKIGTV